MPITVVSRRVSPEELGITGIADLISAADSCFLTSTEGLIGFGEELKLTAKGPNRFQELDGQWKEIVSQATVTDSANLLGSGLVAFGSMSFSEQSNSESYLIVPKVVIGFVHEEFFITLNNCQETELQELLKAKPVTEELTFNSGSITTQTFEENVLKAINLIKEKQISKVVLARDLAAKTNNFYPNSGLVKLARKYPSCYTYLVNNLFGASPELLVSVQNKNVRARVLAGTAGRGTDVEVDQAIGEALSHSHKNLDEHKYAIDSLTSKLEDNCENITADATPFSISLPNLWHLASDVTATLKDDSTSLQLLETLHPSAAVAGTPREDALRVISELEQIDRGRYAGPVGWVSANGDGVWAIALRGAHYDGETVSAFAGCGIVLESDPESELAETNLKFKAVLENF